ncbi:hypothetical protein [Streptomyces soliscabiei]|uniref:hypothetical protein n=1 Tax=Streptomyces soliscabiei TaxID=588897 RepID=UPI0029BA0E7F|nr:hypothetical protein [Streptomyces sp. NY05-11A]MDX2681071.1 hypothetical protein [Streptomyces sp. NY05-11A]
MSAIDEQAAGVAGKSTHDGGQLSVGDATRATLPQLRYGDAVDQALAALMFLPDIVEAGMRKESGPVGRRELFLRAEWLPGHDDLVPAPLCESGMAVEWSHLAGWSVRAGDDLVALDVDELADPATVAEAAMHAALCGLRCDCDKPPPGRWDHAVYLDVALGRFDERTDGVSG